MQQGRLIIILDKDRQIYATCGPIREDNYEEILGQYIKNHNPNGIFIIGMQDEYSVDKIKEQVSLWINPITHDANGIG